ncbi:MAG: bifunctional diaminohydroxyphosphoribosylaminopyrimidine deaminase/5-amino-6-(5-phosphoribosylamino)uracil reductase RibD [Patescibacteria group bacterium]
MQEVFMQKALELAKRGLGFTAPNPCVGAVIIKNGKVIGEGWHKKAGQDHAEIVAIKSVKNKSEIVGADLYVTLEPCSHTGKTGPCAEAIVKAGFKNVYIGMKDPFEKVNGNGIKFLKKNEVVVEICKENSELGREIRIINQPFIKWAKTGIPYVTLKAGMTLDGKIATAGGESHWITSELARQDSKIERSFCDAVLVGSGTVKADDAELAPAAKFSSKKLLRVVLNSKLDLDLKRKVFRDENVFVACSELASLKSREKYEKAGVEFKAFGKEKVDVVKLVRFLGARGVQSVFVEGGSKVHGLFFDENLVDKVLFYVAPKLFGGSDSISVIGGKGVKKIDSSLEFEELQVEVVGQDLKIKGFVNLY